MGEILAVISIFVAAGVVFGFIKKTEHGVVRIKTPSHGIGKKEERGVGPNQKVGVSSRNIGHPGTLTSGKQNESEYPSGQTYYELLGISSNATGKMIKEAWRKKDTGQRLPIETRRAYHMAYKTLSDPQERRKYDANPREWSYENESSQRRGQKMLSKSIANSESGRQVAYSSTHSSAGSNLSNQGKNRTNRAGGIKPQLGRSGASSHFPRRTYSTGSSYYLCQACRWRQNTIRSGRAMSIKGVNRWASANCTCRR